MLPSPDRWHDPALIDHLAAVRAPWDALTRRIVHAALLKFLPQPPGPLVEIGAGGGQLREWLPPHLLADVTHTEPSEPFVRAFRKRHPDARIVQADATALPLEDGSVGAVLVLCVFDTLPDLASVRDELRRVLRPGGKVIHFLDLSTSPDCFFPELIAGGELPLTNFACDRALLDVLTDSQKALLPPADEFDEVIAVPWGAWTAFVGFLEQVRHPLANDLGSYRGLMAPGALDPAKLALEFMNVSANATRLLALNRALLKATLLARQLDREWPLRAISTRSHIRERLKKAFGAEHGFVTEFAGPVAARGEGAVESGWPFTLRHAGRTIYRNEPPTVEYGAPVEVFEGDFAFNRLRLRELPIRETTVELCSLHRI